MGATAIRAGRAYVELFAKSNVTPGLRAASAQLRRFGASLTAIGSRLAGFGLALGAPLLAAAKMFADMGSDMLDMSQRTGVAVEALSELRYAAEQSGASAEDLEVGLRNMSRTIGSGGMSLDRRLEQVADELAAIRDPAARAARAMEIFGRSGTLLLPMLINGAAGLRGLRAEARRLGLTISREDAEAAEAFGDALSTLWTVLKRVAFAIGGALAPALRQVATWLTDAAVSLKTWIEQNRLLVQLVGAGVAGLLALSGVMLILGPLISGVGTALGLVATGIGLVGSAIGFMLATPLGLMLTLLGSAVSAFFVFTSAGQSSVRSVATAFRQLGEVFSTTWGGIRDSLAAGDLQGAFDIGILGLRVSWETLLVGMRGAWRSFSGFFVELWHDAVDMVARLLNRMWIGQQLLAFDVARSIVQAMVGIESLLPGFLNPGAAAAALEALNRAADAAEQEGLAREFEMSAEAHRGRARRKWEGAAAAAADQAGVADLRAQLEKARRAAAGRRSEAERAAGMRAWLMSKKRPTAPSPGLPDLRELRMEAVGTFNPFAVAGIGGSSTAERTARAAEETARNTRGLRRMPGGAVFG